MDKYNYFIIERLEIKNINEAENVFKKILTPDEYLIMEIIILQNKSISYAGRTLGYSNNQIRGKFFKILRKIGRAKLLLKNDKGKL